MVLTNEKTRLSGSRICLMKQIDYTDLNAAESIGHVFGFIAPVLLVVILVVLAVKSFF